MDEHRTAKHQKVFEKGGTRFLFFCDLSGSLVCTTDAQVNDDLTEAWNKQGKQMFNLCRRCGRWVSDPMYNPETLECVQCSPWEDKPLFCPHCGEKATDDGTFCRRCHARLRYSEALEWR